MSGGNELARRLVVLISHERSGSHYLADLLTSGGEVVSLDEVCNFGAVDPAASRASFFRFRQEWQKLNVDKSLRPDGAVMSEFLECYFAHLLELSAKPVVLVDIKYAHVHNFEPAWWHSELRPFLLKFLQKRDVRVIHLTRVDTLAAIVSAMIADERKEWHRRAGSPEPVKFSLRLSVPGVIQRTISLTREKANFVGWLAGNRRLDVEYEQLAGSSAMRDATLATLAAFLALRTRDFTSSFEKMTGPISESVKNYNELRRWLTPFGISECAAPPAE